MHPVPGDDECMFYAGSGRLEDIPEMDGNDSRDSSLSVDDSMIMSLCSNSMSAEEDILGERHSEEEEDFTQNLDIEDIDQSIESVHFDKTAPPPIFIRFKLDGNLVPLRKLNYISQSTKLTAQISIFKTEKVSEERSSSSNQGIKILPWPHRVAAIEITALLKSFVAEQTIQSFRSHGRSISDLDLQLVRRYLKRVRSVETISIEVYFYVSKRDLMTSASAPAGSEAQVEVEEGFLLLNIELKSEINFTFKPLSVDGFVVFPVEGSDTSLEFWCFVYINKDEGVINLNMYHPEGKEKSKEVISSMHSVVRSCLHRVNQNLLLKR
jgi:hypothetical protein